MRFWTEKEIKLLRELFPDNTSKKVAKRLKRSLCSVNGKALALDIEKSDHHKNVTLKKLAGEYAQRPASKAHRFKKGHVPANKGKKGECAPGCEVSWFKKGHLPKNTLYDGAIRIRIDHEDRNGRKQKWIRTSLGKWKELQRFNWEKKYGKIPEGMILRCKNGNTLDCNVNNWRLITKNENCRLNANYKKGALKMREHIRNCEDLKSDKKIAFYLSPRDKKKMKEYLKNKPLLEVKRLEIKLRRGIKNHGN